MRPEVPPQLPLVCPACRARTERGREMHTLSLAETLREGPEGEVLEGVLRCDNPACGRRYPILDGIPVVVPDLAALLKGQAPALLDLEPETEALLVEAVPDDDPFQRQLEHLSIYLDAHWGDRADPPPDGPVAAAPFGLGALCARLRGRPGGRVVELGCSVGRGLAELQPGSEILVGVDLNLGALRRARRLLGGEPVRYGRRAIGRHYRPARAEAGDRAARGAVLLCADALDPPLVPGAWDRAVALGLLDSVRWPGQLLSVLDGLLRPGGELVLACPYSWQSGVVEEGARLFGAAPAEGLRLALTSGQGLEAPYVLEEDAEVPWQLRRDSRSALLYRTHFVRARKA